MMITVHGLPNKTKFQDVKALIKQECNIPDFILDNLVDDGFDSKKIRIGLTNENDGYKLMKCLEGFRMSGSHVLKIVPIGKANVQPQPTFESRSSYSNQRADYQNQSQDYPSQHDYNRQQNIPSHPSHTSSRSIQDTKQGISESRGLLDARKSLSQAMSDSRVQDRYQGSMDRPDRPQGPRTTTDFRDSRGPLAQPALRPVSMDTRAHGAQDSRAHTHLDSVSSLGIRGQVETSYRGPIEHRQTNPEPMNSQPQWNAAGNDQWATPSRPMQNQNTGYNYQQPIAQANTGYGSQTNMATQGNYSQTRAPLAQGYQQPKMAAPERTSTRSHVLRSVQLVESPLPEHGETAFPSAQKPVPIMKDSYQGQGQYNATGQATHSQGYQGQGTQSAWGQPGQQTKQLAYDKSYDERRLALEKRADAKPQITQEYDKRRFSPTRPRPVSPGRSPPRKIPNTATRPGQFSERRISPTRPFTERRDSPNVRASPIRQPSPNRRVSPIRRIPVSTEFNSSGRRISPSKLSQADRRLETRKDSPVRRISPNGRRNSPNAGRRRISPFARKVSPGRHISPRKASPVGGRRASPSGKPISPPARRVSPTGRHISPFSRKISPTGRRASPVRRVSPGRKISPVRRISPGRRVSPVRRISPGRRVSPGRRDESRRMSPSERRMGGRLESPRRYSPKRSSPRGSGRYSPSEIKYDTDIAVGKGVKPIRPAYEPSQAQKYAGGAFRQNEIQYPTGARIEPKISPWQNEKITYPIKKDSRDISRMVRSDPAEKKMSRSRSRSPVKDRFRRHSPSPRSPRRSWALEKRRSPEVNREPPPPPLWPGQDNGEKSQHPVWERNNSDEERGFDNKCGRTGDTHKYKPRFSPRREIDDRRDFRDEPKFERDYRPEDRANYRRESPHRDEKKLFSEVDKDFNDIYQRAVEFRRKTEELRKSNDRRNRSYDEDSPTEETAPRAVHPQKTKPTWIPIKLQTKDLERNTRWRLEPAIKEKRDKATEEIASRILEPHNFTSEQRARVMEELKLSIFNIMQEMFKDKDVSYIELVIKFRARYDIKDEEKILQDVLSSMPSHYRNMLKRKGEGITDAPSKVAKLAPAMAKQELQRPKLCDAVIPDWMVSIDPPKVLNLPVAGVVPPMINAASAMVQPPVYMPGYQMAPPMYPPSLQSDMEVMQATLQSQMQSNLQSQMQSMQHNLQSHLETDLHSQTTVQENTRAPKESYDLYLCQDDFETFSDNQAEKLKDFLVTQMFKASETGNGWAPDFSLKGLHSKHRYELSTRDEASKNWIINLDFSEFEFFNVLVYTKEELWYERAAIWLPGHSRYRNIEPLEKLRLQNQHVEGIKIGKWKFVKKIVTVKGTRLYVDMPPSSARALEKKQMMLSYELGKVNVYLKAVAVDKEVFDAGLKAHSITDPSEIANALQATILPTLPSQLGIIKVTINGAKSITILQAGKIKEMVVYHLFKYLQQQGRSKTDFLKYGFCPPNCIGIIPENTESKRWLLSQSFGKLNRELVVVLGGEDTTTKYFRMRALVPKHAITAEQNIQFTMERLKSSNQGVKGLNFQYWKPISFTDSSLAHERGKAVFEVDVDLESVEALIKILFKLDYVDQYGSRSVSMKSDYSISKLKEKIKKYKAEQVDSYDVANMELDSDPD